MKICLLLLIVMTLGVFAFEGCSDKKQSKSDAGPDSDAGNAGGKGGRGGAGGGGTGGRKSTTGTAGSSSDAVKCGSMMCQSPAGAMGFITACCADEKTSTCGTSAMGGTCAVPSAGDPRCPKVEVMGFGITLPSCCTAQGQCGLDASMFGMPGCIDLATAATQAASMGMGMGGPLPAPRGCADTGADAGSANDAGL
jgi:hypothetical protein